MESISSIAGIRRFLEENADDLMAQNLLTASLQVSVDQMCATKDLLTLIRPLKTDRNITPLSVDKSIDRAKLEALVSNADRNQLRYAADGQALLGAMDTLAAVSGKLGAMKKEIEALEIQRNDTFANQKRLRENLSSLNEGGLSGSKLVKRYLSDMDKEESTLIANTQRLQDLKRRVSEITEIVIVRVRGVQATADQLWMCAKRFGIPAKT